MLRVSTADQAPGQSEGTGSGSGTGTGSGTVGEVFRAFLKLGLTSFGGPIAHLGYFRDELVTRRRWVRESEYADLIALGQFLPGPASSQVGFALGLFRAGPWGGLAAWAAFTLPSAALMVAFAFGASLFEGWIGTGVLTGLEIVAVAIVWFVLGQAGVFDSINSMLSDVIGGEGNSFDITTYFGTSRVIGFTMLAAVLNVVLLTALSTLAAFLYNLAATLLGGIEVTWAGDR